MTPGAHAPGSCLWHPFADMGRTDREEVVIARGEGVWVWDEQGNRYLDGSASLWYANVGHGRSEIAAAVAAQMGRIETYHAFGDFATRPALELAERLAACAPSAGSRVMLLSGGGDAIDTALKLARMHGEVVGEPGRRHVISRENGYHGTHAFGTSIVGIDAFRDGFGTLVGEVSRVPYDSVEALEAEIERVGPGNVAAFVFEPVIGSGGVLAPPPGYLEGVSEVCRRHGVLTVADAVICGFGRLGGWYGVERWGLQPDVIAFAKGVTSGYLPLGGIVVSDRVAEPFWEREGNVFSHGPTYSAHAACCAAALANLDLLERDGLLTRVLELEGEFHGRLAPLAAHPLVDEVRGGVGLMAAVALDPALCARDPHAPTRFAHAARQAGLLTRQLREGLAVAPPLIAEREHFDLIHDAFATALAALATTV